MGGGMCLGDLSFCLSRWRSPKLRRTNVTPAPPAESRPTLACNLSYRVNHGLGPRILE
jgi:hypothetical protein